MAREGCISRSRQTSSRNDVWCSLPEKTANKCLITFCPIRRMCAVCFFVRLYRNICIDDFFLFFHSQLSSTAARQFYTDSSGRCLSLICVCVCVQYNVVQIRYTLISQLVDDDSRVYLPLSFSIAIDEQHHHHTCWWWVSLWKYQAIKLKPKLITCFSVVIVEWASGKLCSMECI